MKDKGKRILVVEKDDATRELILMRLHSRHHKVFEASKSSQALRFLDREVLDLILLSSDMEPVSGKMLIPGHSFPFPPDVGPGYHDHGRTQADGTHARP